MEEKSAPKSAKKTMPHLITPDTLYDVISKIAVGKQSDENRLSCWNDINDMLILGVGVKPNNFEMLFNLICSVESETTRLIRTLTFKVAYRLMLKNDPTMKEAVYKNLLVFFRNLLFGMMDTTVELRIISELCMVRLLTSILSREDALCTVIGHFEKSKDIDNPDVCKMFTWVLDRFQPSSFSRDLQKLFLGAFEIQLEKSKGFKQKKLINLLNMTLSKTDNHFYTASQMVLAKATATTYGHTEKVTDKKSTNVSPGIKT